MLFHVANSGGILTGVGTELDMMRPGIALYGLPPGKQNSLTKHHYSQQGIFLTYFSKMYWWKVEWKTVEL